MLLAQLKPRALEGASSSLALDTLREPEVLVHDPFTLAGQADQAFGILRRIFWHPKLDLTFPDAETYRVAGRASHPGRRATYVHLVCVNRSWFVHALNCRASLKALWRLAPSGGWEEHRGFVGPVLMRWANTPETGGLANAPLELDPMSSRRLDLGYTLDGEPTFNLYIPSEYTGVVRRLVPGVYLVLVEAKASNALPRHVRRYFAIHIASDGLVAVEPGPKAVLHRRTQALPPPALF
jgi:hypothetical protein